MEPLLSIKTIPVDYELKITNASLEYTQGSTQVEISKNKGGLKIKSQPIKLNMDTFEARSSICPTTIQSVQQAAERGRSIAYAATAEYAKEGHLLVNAKLGENVFAQIDAQRNQLPTGEFELAFLPNVGPNIEWTAPDLTIEYQMDTLNFDLKVSNGRFEFIPGNIELCITNKPEVIIEYIGGPLYVPPSAEENFNHIDVKA
ncbi:DUF6470 family protein [Lachnospiraceae bacterium LCP25S3_G4]